MPKQDSVLVQQLLSRYPVISDQVDERELTVILNELGQSLAKSDPKASVAELGCYIGTTSLFIRRVLDGASHEGAFHVYDSFRGLPEKTLHDSSPAGDQFKAGELSVGRKTFEMQFKKAGIQTPIIHKAWFSDLGPADIPEQICFAYLDGDYYESIRDSLRLIAPNLAPGATVVVDDYANEALPGAAKAVDEWLRTRQARLRIEASLAILYVA